MKIKNLKVGTLRKLLIASSFSLISASLTGCSETELSTNGVDDSKIVDFNDAGTDDFLENGIRKVINVPGEEFKLVIEYSGEMENGEYWTVTDNKKLYTKIYTEDLPLGYEVYINDIHVDTSIVAKQKQMDGIKQDTMDGGVHNSTLPGFLIGNDSCYYGVNQIDGQNDEFIQGTMIGYESYSSGTVTQKRFLESDYLEKGVIANQVSSVYTLLVKGPDDISYRGISVDDDIYIKIYNKVLFVDNLGEEYYKVYITAEDGTVNYATELIEKNSDEKVKTYAN